jgi:predicted transcriptional regulator
VVNSRGNYRGRIDILASILRTVERENNELGLTRLMYSSFISFKQVKEYLGILKDNNLLNYDTTTKKYKITTNGLKFLELYEKLDNMFHIEE